MRQPRRVSFAPATSQANEVSACECVNAIAVDRLVRSSPSLTLTALSVSPSHFVPPPLLLSFLGYPPTLSVRLSGALACSCCGGGQLDGVHKAGCARRLHGALLLRR